MGDAGGKLIGRRNDFLRETFCEKFAQIDNLAPGHDQE
jgi:hypothetical protein